MTRFQAIRYSMMLGAVVRPVALFVGFMLIATQKEAVYIILCVAAIMLVSLVPRLCEDPRKEEATGHSCLKCNNWILEGRFVVTYLMILSFAYHAVLELMKVGIPRLLDWVAISAVALFCGTLLYKGVKSALGFSPTDLLPEPARPGDKASA